jgi:hypothetical protein
LLPTIYVEKKINVEFAKYISTQKKKKKKKKKATMVAWGDCFPQHLKKCPYHFVKIRILPSPPPSPQFFFFGPLKLQMLV